MTEHKVTFTWTDEEIKDKWDESDIRKFEEQEKLRLFKRVCGYILSASSFCCLVWLMIYTSGIIGTLIVFGIVIGTYLLIGLIKWLLTS